MNKYKKLIINIVWLFIIGAFIGYIIETLWYFLKHGTFINKQGLWIGPFKPLYGIGILIITLLMYKIKDKNIFIIFLSGLLIGSIYEYASHLFQEYFFHTYTWTYNSFNYNINGRIYLPYTFLWGLLSVLYFKLLYPAFIKIIKRIESNKFFILTIILGIFMIYNITLTTLITIRYSERQNNILPNNKIDEILDKYYPDEIIKERFPKLRVYK